MRELHVGLMTGTSLDGIDAALVAFEGSRMRLLNGIQAPMTEALRRELLALASPGNNEAERCALAANDLARAYAAAVRDLLRESGRGAAEIATLGCHGQTVRHRPDLGYSLQLINPALLAELTGITVVADFRSRDIAAGGQGAPLAPAFHAAWFASPRRHRVVVNIGGIANLTDLPPRALVTGFDCGPGNILMDGWSARHTGQTMDRDGAWAETGAVLPELLAHLLAHPFFDTAPPKSTGREQFNLAWLQTHLTSANPPQDVQATLLQLTVDAIALAISRYCAAAQEVYLCGGGAYNTALLKRLQARLAIPVTTTDPLGIAPSLVEACAFAWLARKTLHGKPGNLPQVTGARYDCILGAIYRA
ncbi:MAG: anhydro-N-acetylmuramic acid kinase [Burkholderiales bacterium]